MIDFFTNWWGIGFLTLLTGGGMAAVAVFFPAVVGTLLASKTGRIILAIGFAIVFVGFALLVAFAKGRAREAARQKLASLRNIQIRVQNDTHLRSLPADERRRRLDRWVTDE